jgi:branched-chain amino acid transport system permease protein
MYGLMASPHLSENFPGSRRCSRRPAHLGVAGDPLGAAIAGFFGILLGAPTLKLRGDYLAIVTLGFGEIIRVFLNNLDHPVNITNGPRAWRRSTRSPVQVRRAGHPGLNLGRPLEITGLPINSVTLYYYLFLALVLVSVSSATAWSCRASAAPGWRSARTRSPPRRWHQHRNMKLLAFGMGATFGGVSGTMFAAFQGFSLARVVLPDGVGDDRRHGGAGRHRPPAGRDPGRRCCCRRCRRCCAGCRACLTCSRSPAAAWMPPSCASC